MSVPKGDRDAAAEAVAWVVHLLHAEQVGDRGGARNARRQLGRLGLTVRIRRDRGGVAHAGPVRRRSP